MTKFMPASPDRPVRTDGLNVGVGGLEISARAKRYLNEVIESNRLSYGPFTKRFEETFAKLHSCRFGVFCNSGTSALHVSLQALKERYGWTDGDEVLVPAVTFVATANIVIHNRMTPIFVDVDSATYNIDPARIEQAITPRTRAIIPVHLMGLPADMTAIMALARRHGLRVIEDSCEAMFATCHGRTVGSFGDLGCFSTYVAHLLVTGVGGIVTTNDPELAVDIRSLCNHGRDGIYLNIDDDRGKSGDDLFEVVQRRFRFVRLGHSMRCTEMEAALGVAQIEEFDGILMGRRRVADYFNRELSDLADVLKLPEEPEGRTHVYMLYPLVVLKEPKDGLIRHLESHGVETRDLMPLVNQPIYQDLYGSDLEDRFPVAKLLNRHGFYIGCHPYISDSQLGSVVELIREYFKASR